MAKSNKEYSLNDMDRLIKSIQAFEPGTTEEEVARLCGYNEGYFSQTRSRGKVSPKTIATLQRIYNLGSTRKTEFDEFPEDHKPSGPVLGSSKKELTVDDYIAEVRGRAKEIEEKARAIEEHNLFLQRLLMERVERMDSNLERISERQYHILGEIKGGLKYQAVRDAQGDKKQERLLMAQASTYSGEYYLQLKEADKKNVGGR